MTATTGPGGRPIPGEMTIVWRPEVVAEVRPGLLALEHGLIGPHDLIKALQRWLEDGGGPLDAVLVDSGAMTEADRAFVVSLSRAESGDREDTSTAPTLPGAGPLPTLLDVASAADPAAATERMPGAGPTDYGSPPTEAGSGPGVTARGVAADGPIWNDDVRSDGSRYRIVREFARGGLGVVSVAIDAELRREVAIKELRPELADDPASRAQFLREAEITGRLEHPGIVPIYGLGLDGRGRLFYAMRLVDGESLDEALTRHHEGRAASGPGDAPGRILELRRLLGRFVSVCGVVAYAHSRGVIHRDIKPSNILLGPYGETMLVDWGLARSVDDSGIRGEAAAVETSPPLAGEPTALAGDIAGTPAYMSPEQATGHPESVGPASDVFNLGATLHHLLAGEPPFPRGDLTRSLERTRRDPWRSPRDLDPTIPRELDAICRRAMAIQPGDRYASPLDLAGDVERWLADEPLPWLAQTWGERVSRWERRNRLMVRVGGAALAVVAMVATVAAVLVGASREQERAHRREAEVQRKRAEDEQRRAEDRSREFQRLSARTVLDNGLALCARGEIGRGMLQLTRGLTLAAPGDPDLEQMARVGLGGWSGRLHRLRVRMETGNKTRAKLSPDGSRVVTASDDHTARIWDAVTGRPITLPLPHDDEVNRAFFQPDGRRVVTACNDGRARIWDASTGQLVFPPLEHGGPINDARFSPDGQLVATASDDGTARIWDARTGRPSSPPLRHGGTVLRVAFSPDSRRLATSSRDGTARIWDVETGQPITDPLRHEGEVVSIAFSPEGRRIVTAGTDSTVRVWDASTGRALIPPISHRKRVNLAVFSPDGGRIATASDDFTAMVWDATTGRALIPPIRHRGVVIAVAFSPDGSLVSTASQDRTARVWDAADGAPIGSAMLHRDWVYSAEFAPDGHRILTSDRNGIARVWDLASPPHARMVLTHPSRVLWVEYAPNGRRLATASGDGAVRIWDADIGRPVGPTIHVPGGKVRSLAYSPDGRRLATAGTDDKARIWDAETGKPAGPTVSHRFPLNHVSFRRDGLVLLTAGQDGTARAWDVATGRPIGEPILHPRWIWTAIFDPDGRRILTSCGDGKARIWDADSHGLAVGPMADNVEVWWAMFSPDGLRVLTAGQGNTVRLWDARNGSSLGAIAEHRGPVHTARYSADGSRIVTASDDETAQVWDAEGRHPLLPPMEHGEAVRMAAFRPDARQIVTASGEHSVRLWDVPAPLEIASDRVADWLTATTGTALDERGSIVVLDGAAWDAARRRLDSINLSVPGPRAAGP